jgi:hypothetical protein
VTPETPVGGAGVPSNGPSQSNTTAKDRNTPTLGRPSLAIHKLHGKLVVTGKLPVLDYTRRPLERSLCRGRVTTALGRTTRLALRHPYVKRSAKLSPKGGCHVPIALRLPTLKLPKTGHLRVAYAGGSALTAFSASLPVKLR